MAEVFQRGSAVLDYWLAHPEGLTVRPLDARVERAIGPVPFGPAEALVVRSRSGRERVIPAEQVAAVVPANDELILDRSERGGGDPIHDSVARVVGGAGRNLVAGALVVWDGAVFSCRAGRAGAVWAAPRVASGCRSLAARRPARRDTSGDSPQTWPVEAYPDE